jgi:hypothetical protein
MDRNDTQRRRVIKIEEILIRIGASSFKAHAIPNINFIFLSQQRQQEKVAINCALKNEVSQQNSRSLKI